MHVKYYFVCPLDFCLSRSICSCQKKSKSSICNWCFNLFTAEISCLEGLAFRSPFEVMRVFSADVGFLEWSWRNGWDLFLWNALCEQCACPVYTTVPSQRPVPGAQLLTSLRFCCKRQSSVAGSGSLPSQRSMSRLLLHRTEYYSYTRACFIILLSRLKS